MPGSRTDFSRIMGQVVEALAADLGKPIKGSRGKVLRFGSSRGSLEVDLDRGVWTDFADVGGNGSTKGGGVIDLVCHVKGFPKADAVAFIEGLGLIAPSTGQGGNGRGHGARPASRRSSGPNGAVPFERVEEPEPAEVIHGRTVREVYQYRDEDGAKLYEVVRFEPKGFIPRREIDGETVFGLDGGDYVRNDRGEWYPRRKDDKGPKRAFLKARDIPYRLPEIRTAIVAGETIFIVEGEKDANRIFEEGGFATTNAGGWGKWPIEFASFFVGADVVVIADNDKVGRQGANKKCANLHRYAKSLRVVWQLPVKEKGDVSDWFDADPDRTFNAFRFLVGEIAEPWRPISQFDAITAAEIDKPEREHEWLVRGLITKGERGLIFGPPEAAKSFLLLGAAISIARGKPWFGRRTDRGVVVWFAGEGELGLKKRIRAFRQAHDIRSDEWKTIPLVVLPKRVDMFNSDDDTDKMIEEARTWAEFYGLPLALVVIDTFSKATPGLNENSSEDVSRVLNRQDKLSRELQASVVFVHHCGVEGKRPRGHTSLEGDSENVLHVRRDPDGRLDGQGREIRLVEATKQKDDKSNVVIEFVLETVTLGFNQFDEPITSCVCVPPAEAGLGPNRREPIAMQGGRARLTLKVLLDLLTQRGAVHPDSQGRLAVYLKDWRDAITPKLDGDDDDKRRENARAAVKWHVEKTQSRDAIRVAGDIVFVGDQDVLGFIPEMRKLRRTKTENEEGPMT